LVFAHIAVGVVPAGEAWADGCFLKPVWNKQMDINEPTQKAIIVYDGGREDLVLQVKYEGPVNEFGWLVPVPSVPKVEKGSINCFYELSRLTQGMAVAEGAGTLGLASAGSDHRDAVRVIEQKTVGAYEVAVLAATDAGSLQRWLEQNQFVYPRDSGAVIEEYVRKAWYFVAMRIQLGAGDSFKMSAPKTVTTTTAKRSATGVSAKLARGELHPLQISFDTPRCIFPLKISAVNGHPSEISLYVLAREPLMEKSLFAQDVEKARQKAVTRPVVRGGPYEQMQMMHMEMRARQSGAPMSAAEAEAMRALQQTENPWGGPRASVSFIPFIPGPEFHANLSSVQLPECARRLPRLKANEWCLTKQTRTFAPAEMHDLEFEPATEVLGAYLADEQAGSAIVYLLQQCGPAGEARLRQALSSTNGVERALGASQAIRDPELRKHLAGMIHDPEPKVRARALEAGIADRGPQANAEPQRLEEMLQFLSDPDIEVRQAAAGAISRQAVTQNQPRFLQMLREPDPHVQTAAFGMLARDFENVQIPREELRRLFATTNLELACSFGVTPLVAYSEATSDDVAILLTNRFVHARLTGIALLELRPDKRAIGLAVTALQDQNLLVQKRAWRFLMAQTDQTFASEEPGKWAEWWTAHQATFTPKSAEQLRAESLERRRRAFESRRGSGAE
jgi:HEAT repeat protein